MKKWIAFLLSVLFVFGTCACAKTPAGDAPGDETLTTDDAPGEIKTDNGETAAVKGDFSDLKSFTAETLDGQEISEEIFKDHDLTVINIWATYCPPCLAEMPDLAEFAASLPARVQFLTLCTDALPGNAAKARQILDDAGFQGTTLVTGTGDLITLLNEVLYIPTTLFYDASGQCVGEEIIGGQVDFAAGTSARINEILALLGKDAI